MVISVQVSLYSLRQESLAPGIRAFTDTLKASGLATTIGPMSTIITGEGDTLFAALRDGFSQAAETGHVVMTLTVSNACPI